MVSNFVNIIHLKNLKAPKYPVIVYSVVKCLKDLKGSTANIFNYVELNVENPTSIYVPSAVLITFKSFLTLTTERVPNYFIRLSLSANKLNVVSRYHICYSGIHHLLVGLSAHTRQNLHLKYKLYQYCISCSM